MTLLTVQSVANKIIICGKMSFLTSKYDFGKCLNESGRFKAKNLYLGVGTFWGLSGEFVVYTFILMLTKNQKNQTTGIRDFLA